MDRYLRELLEFSRWLTDRAVRSPSAITRELLEDYMLYVRTLAQGGRQAVLAFRVRHVRAGLHVDRDLRVRHGGQGLPQAVAGRRATSQDAASRRAERCRLSQRMRSEIIGPTSSPDSPRESKAARTTAFLKSGTGLVTATTALIVAIGGFLTAIGKLDGGDDQPPAKTATPASTGTSLHRVRSYVPSGIADSCGASDAPEDGSTAALDCSTEGVDGIQYNLFASASTMARAYARQRHKLGGDRSGCANGTFDGEYVVDGRRRGRLLCFVHHPGEAAIVWTNDDLKVLSFAWRDDEDPEALYEAWKPGLGPTG
jgi:hypothetical protein